VQTLIDDGRITEEEANSHPQRSLLLRALNGQDVEPDLSMRDARAGDRYLICSDGLSGVVTFETLAAAMSDPDPQATADRLIELALRSGGPDNITCIVADVVEDDGRGALIDPVVDGAAGDNRGQREVDPQSAAGRAALAGPQPAQANSAVSTGGPPPRRRRPLRTALIALAALVVLGAVAIGGYLFVMGHWFVGVAETGDGDEVAVFQGLNASIVGVDLYRLDQATGLATTDLTQAARSRVSGGISATDQNDAQRILANLRGQRLPLCHTTPSTASSTSSSPAAGTSPSAGATPTSVTPVDPAATATAAPTSSAPTTTAAATSTGQSRSQTPGVDCREGD
jgi:protein phosphatase